MTRIETPTRTRGGFSLTELLVASAIALVVMGAVATLFGIFSRALSLSQTTVDLGGRMRLTAWQLRQDLAGVTLEVAPYVNPESDKGYFALIEGPRRDSSAVANTTNIEADTDDVLLFTTRAIPGPFASRYNTDTIEGPCAEVGWWLQPAVNQTVPGVMLYELCRRQLVVASFVGKTPFDPGNWLSGAAVTSAQQFYDVSLRTESGKLIPNTLGDLSKRESRFTYATSGQATAVATVSGGAVTQVTLISPGWGYTPSATPLVTFSGGGGSGAAATATANANGTVTVTLSSGGSGYTSAPSVTISSPVVGGASLRNTTRDGEDVMLTNVIAFDVRVFDPQARSQVTGTTVRYPGDPNYAVASATGPAGAYVDLAAGQAAGPLSAAMNAKHPALTSGYPTYDTWSMAYEFNGVGTNGQDDNGDGLPDDPGEFVKPPPYGVPLRGIEVRIRCYEPSSNQVRQITVRHTFLQR